MTTASNSPVDALTSQQKEDFFEQGFVHVPNVFTEEETGEMGDAMNALHEAAMQLTGEIDPSAGQSGSVTHLNTRCTFQRPSESSDWTIRHIAWVAGMSPVLGRYGADPRLLAIAGSLLGSREMDQLIMQCHYKRPNSGVEFAWHQDGSHRGMQRGEFVDTLGWGSYVQIAIAIDRVTPESGPLSFIPGSNKHGLLGPKIPQVVEEGPAPVGPLLAPGDVAAFSPYTIHGSSPNRSDVWRRTFINGFAAPDANKKDFGDWQGPGTRRSLDG